MSGSSPSNAPVRVKAEQLFHVSPLDKTTKVTQSFNSGYLGQCSVVQDSQTQKALLLKEVVYNTEEEFVVGVMYFQRKKGLRDDGLLYVIDFSAEKISNFCSSFYKVKVYLLPHFTDLKKMIKQKQTMKSEFSEMEITYLLFHSVNGLAELHKAGFTHKQISPEAIDMTNMEHRNPKLIHLDEEIGATSRQVAYNNIFKNKDVYLAPEIFQRTPELTKTGNQLSFDEHKLDAFSLGMTILHAGVGKPVQDCYDTKRYVFNDSNLSAHINNFKNRYSGNLLLVESLDRLLALDVDRRSTAVSLQTELPGLEEINEYFQITGDSFEDYNLIYPLSQDDKRNYQSALNYFASTGRLYQPPQQPQNYMQGMAGSQGSPQSPRGPTGQNQQPPLLPTTTTSQWDTTRTPSGSQTGPGQPTGQSGQWSNSQGNFQAGGSQTSGFGGQFTNNQQGQGFQNSQGLNQQGFQSQWSNSRGNLPQPPAAPQNQPPLIPQQTPSQPQPQPPAQNQPIPQQPIPQPPVVTQQFPNPSVGPTGNFKPGPQGGAVPGFPSGFDNSNSAQLGGWAQQGTQVNPPNQWQQSNQNQWGPPPTWAGPAANQGALPPVTPAAPASQQQPPLPTQPAQNQWVPPQNQPVQNNQTGWGSNQTQTNPLNQSTTLSQNKWAPPAGPVQGGSAQSGWAGQGAATPNPLDQFKYPNQNGQSPAPQGQQRDSQPQKPANPANQNPLQQHQWSPPTGPVATPAAQSQSWAGQGWQQPLQGGLKPKAIQNIQETTPAAQTTSQGQQSQFQQQQPASNLQNQADSQSQRKLGGPVAANHQIFNRNLQPNQQQPLAQQQVQPQAQSPEQAGFQTQQQQQPQGFQQQLPPPPQQQTQQAFQQQPQQPQQQQQQQPQQQAFQQQQPQPYQQQPQPQQGFQPQPQPQPQPVQPQPQQQLLLQPQFQPQPQPQPLPLIPVQQLQQPEYLRRSASQPVFFTQPPPQQVQIVAPPTLVPVSSTTYTRPVSYSHTHSATVLPLPTTTLTPLPVTTTNLVPITVTQAPTVTCDANPVSYYTSENPRRVRSSSHNIIRNGVVVGVNNPVDEIRASRIVISKDKIDYFMDDKPPTTTIIPATTMVTSPSKIITTTHPTLSGSMVSSTPFTHLTSAPVYQAPTTSYSSSVIRSPSPVIHQGHTVIGSPSHRTYNPTPVTRISGITHVAGPTRVGAPVHVSGGVPSSTYIGATTQRRIIGSPAPGTTLSTSNVLSGIQPATSTATQYRSNIGSSYNIKRTGYESSTPQKSLDGKTVLTTFQPTIVRKKEDSDIKPRELDTTEDNQAIADPVWNE